MSLVGQRRSFLSSLPILSSSLPGRICCTRTMLGTEPRRSSSMLRGRSSAFNFLFAKALRGIGRRPLYPVAAAFRRQLELHEADARSAEGAGRAGLVRCHQRRCGPYSPLQSYSAASTVPAAVSAAGVESAAAAAELEKTSNLMGGLVGKLGLLVAALASLPGVSAHVSNQVAESMKAAATATTTGSAPTGLHFSFPHGEDADPVSADP